ncbi:OTU domain-containing protein [Legionella tunisiensis]|uniref:OTU domain-containing protein n=1 Tax=Legionella tunisiensis TaxID=1034944 RepID=UPI00030C38AC|nr:OTU domain-containing protein [Legionella tunisiensis]
MPILSVTSTPGFFTRQLGSVAKPIVKPSPEPSFVNVGGTGDCGFRSVAACLIDDYLFKRNLANQQLLEKILARYFDYFPHPQPFGRTARDRLESMTRSPLAMAECTRRFAYVLRQIAVDELCTYPEKYRGAFASFEDNDQHAKEDKETTPQQMRQETTWIDESAIAALSNALGELPIEVQVVTKNRALPMRLQYNVPSDTTPAVVMQLQKGHYIPRVSQPARFMNISEQQSNMGPLQPVTRDIQDPPQSEILAKIAAEDQRLRDEFDQTLNQLTASVVAGEVTKEELLEIYIKGMAKSDYLQGRIKYVGLEHGNQRFFEAIESAKPGAKIKAVKLDSGSHDEQVITELVHAIARAISIGQLNPNMVFAKIEHDEDIRPTAAPAA